LRLRIISGDLGGRYIEVPRRSRIRPTPERVREAWFSALAGDLVGTTVLDLYAGTGILGVEALSRGAAHVHFVEKDRRAAALLRHTLQMLGLQDRGTVITGNARSWIGQRFEGQTLAFDIGLADPPYRMGEAGRLLALFHSTRFAGELWIEHEARLEWADVPAWTGRYGDTWLSRFPVTRA